MKHETEIVGYKKLSDGQFSVALRCCGDQQHDTWHTFDGTAVLDEATFAANLQACRELAANGHAAAIVAESALKQLVGSRQQHDVGSE